MKRILYKPLKITFICLLFAAVLSCKSDDDSVFDQTPTERKNQSRMELENLLQGSEGFKVVYFPKDAQYGGFLFYMKFDEEGNVEMISNIDDEEAFVSSKYEVRSASATELVFTTPNSIHKLSDNRTPGLIGTGYEGHSQFQFKNVNEEGDLIFGDLRSEGKMVLEPVGQDVLDNAIELIEESRDKRTKLTSSPQSSVFQTLEFKVGDQNATFDLNFDILTQFAEPFGVTVESPFGGRFDEFGIAFTPDGLVVSPAITYAGAEFKEFTYDEDEDVFKSEVNGSTAIIGKAGRPGFITDDYLDVFEKDGGYPIIGYRPYSWGDNALTSSGFNALWDAVDANLTTLGAGFRLEYFQFNLSNIDEGGCESYFILFFRRLSDGGVFRADFCFTKAVLDDKLVFIDYEGPANGNASYIESDVMPLLEFFASENGLVVTLEGSFSTNLLSYTNESGTFTSLDNPSQRVYVIYFN